MSLFKLALVQFECRHKPSDWWIKGIPIGIYMKKTSCRKNIIIHTILVRVLFEFRRKQVAHSIEPLCCSRLPCNSRLTPSPPRSMVDLRWSWSRRINRIVFFLVVVGSDLVFNVPFLFVLSLDALCFHCIIAILLVTFRNYPVGVIWIYSETPS